jgi:hypothetical protein
MNETRLDPPDDADPWTIPLHGTVVPIPPSADVPASAAGIDAPGADTDAILGFPGADDVPSDVGFHPRLRRSA